MNIKNFKESLDYLFDAKLTPFVWGHAGIGKTSAVKQYADKKGYLFFPFYLGTQSDLGDILGLADFERDKNGTVVATKFATPDWLKNTIEYCKQNPDSGAIIFLDEFNRARRDILNGMFSLALDKTFHTITLPSNCHVIAAGNPPTEEYYVTDVNETALMARFVHIKLEPSFEEWVTYAKEKSMETTLVDFLKMQPELLEEKRSNFDLPIKVDRRSFERLSRLFALKTPSHLMEDLMPGIIGLERTVAYKTFLKESDTPLTGEEVLTMDASSEKKLRVWSNVENIQTSLLNLTSDKLKDHLKTLTSLDATQKENLMNFFTIVPKDISFPVIRELVSTTCFKDFYQDKKYKKAMLELVATVKGVQL